MRWMGTMRTIEDDEDEDDEVQNLDGYYSLPPLNSQGDSSMLVQGFGDFPPPLPW
jgi:hypothetical protein